MRENADKLIARAHLFTMKGDGMGYVADGAVAVQGNCIAAVGPTSDLEARYSAPETIDATGCAVLPGLIDAHMHTPLALVRGVAQDVAHWMQRALAPYSRHITPDAALARTRLNILEALKASTTTMVDHTRPTPGSGRTPSRKRASAPVSHRPSTPCHRMAWLCWKLWKPANSDSRQDERHGNMNNRKRVLSALRHQEPDRIPIDFGGIVDSTISALSYQALRKTLGLPPTITRVQDIYQYTAVVEDDVREALGADTTPVLDLPAEWRSGTLPDGTEAQFPARFQPQRQPDGSQVVFDASGTVVLKMPARGYYFDPVHSPLAGATSVRDIDRCMDQIESYDHPDHLDSSYEELARVARALREQTSYLLVAFFGGHIFQAAQSLRGWDTFLTDLLINRPFAEALLERLCEANLRRFDHFARTVGRYVDVVHFEDDLGMQDRPLLRPELYRQVIKPHHSRLFGFARANCSARLLFHTDGAIAPLVPDLIEMGIDALNPVQVSAAGMDPATLKREFGREITFWGGGCDSQSVLPFGTPQEVADEVKRRIDALAPGGGFIFGPIHNIQAGVPLENIVTMFRVAREYGVY